jgi:uncharacterized protein (TIGR02246 family)
MTPLEVAFVVDDAIGQGASGMRFLEVRGHAEQVRSASPGDESPGPYLIRIRPRRLVSWNLDPEHPGMQTRDVIAAADPTGPEADRPTLDAGGSVAREATEAVTALVAELQAGWDGHDADVSNRHFADDLLWGSPFGAIIHGYEELHAIHVRLKQRGVGGPSSRYEIVKVLAPAPGVAVAQVRRVALDPHGEPIVPTGQVTGSFSEMALYVLVRRGGTWWLAAGQNTPVRPAPSS